MNSPAAAPGTDSWAEQALDAMLGRVFAQLRPRPPLSPGEWAEKYRRLSAEENPDYAGKFSLENTPILRGILAACGQRGVRRVVVQKSAQIGYTAGVVATLMGYHIHWKPRVQVAMFPREQSAKDFNDEKFVPMVQATPVLSRRIKLKSRSDGNSATRKKYPGGRLKFVASNSPAGVKSTSAAVLYVEEPDDTNKDVRGQGSSITLLGERGKTIRDRLLLIGGTPTAKGASEIEEEMRTTDQRRFLVACHECGEKHEPAFEYMTIPGLDLTAEELAAPDIDSRYPYREVYGRARWEDAYYACPHCGSIWTDRQRVRAIRQAARQAPHYGWEPTAPGADPGFYCNEWMSVFEGSYISLLAEKYLKAIDALERGDTTKMVAFHNSSRGLPWEYTGELPEEEELIKRAEKYAEWTVPAGGLEAFVTVDVQHGRLAICCWVFGRGEEMWIAFWGEVYGSTIVPFQGAWLELEQLLATASVRSAAGYTLPIAAVGIDCSDGQTSDASYGFVRRHHRHDREVLALKGAPDDEGRVEIWTPPKPIDPNRKATKASRFGVQIHQIGTAKAKDQILGWATQAGRVRLTGQGAGRMHWYEGIRADFYEQLLSEIKIPGRDNPNRRRWKRRTDRRNEVLDCTVMAVYLYRHRKLHLRRPGQWDLLEMRLRQGSLALPAADDPPSPPTQQPPEATPAAVETSAPPPASSVDPAAARLAALLRARKQRHGR